MSHSLPIEVRIPVQWGDLDALGHVNNTVYFRWFETARIALFEAVGLDNKGQPTVGPILAHTSCTFREPLGYPDTVLARAGVTKVGNTSFVMRYEVARAAAPEGLVAEGEGVIVLVDYGTGEKVPIAGALREALVGLCRDPSGD